MQFYVFAQPDDTILSCWHVLEHGDAPEAQGQHGQPVSIGVSLFYFYRKSHKSSDLNCR